MASTKRNGGGAGGGGGGSKWVTLGLFGIALNLAFLNLKLATLPGKLMGETATTTTTPSTSWIKRNDTSDGGGGIDVGTDRAPSKSESLHNEPLRQHEEYARRQHARPLPARPTLIMHVGPMKTATTTIQLGLADNSELLQRESVYYLGKCDQPQCEDRIKSTFPIRRALLECILRGFNGTSCGKLGTLSDTLDHHRARNHSVIVSAEEFCGMVERRHDQGVWGLLRDTFAGFNIRVVVGYRRLYEWVPSMQNQGQKPRRTKPRWKPIGKVKIFPQAYEYYVENPSDQMCTTRSLVDGFRRHFSDVAIFNMHRSDEGGGDDVLANFVCTHIPEAPKTCAALRGGGGPDAAPPNERRSNPSFPLHLYFMAIAARAHGVLDNTVKVLDAVHAMQDYEKSKGLDPVDDVPWKCISPEQEQLLLNRSLEIEGELLPAWAAIREVREAHRNGFEVARSRKKFCSVAVRKALGTNGWMEFIRTIAPS